VVAVTAAVTALIPTGLRTLAGASTRTSCAFAVICTSVRAPSGFSACCTSAGAREQCPWCPSAACRFAACEGGFLPRATWRTHALQDAQTLLHDVCHVCGDLLDTAAQITTVQQLESNGEH
jgi:hypothetical protein